MQMFNVQSKNRQEVSLVYCTNQTKRLMGKELKPKTIEQSSIRKGSPTEGVRVYGGKDLRKITGGATILRVRYKTMLYRQLVIF